MPTNKLPVELWLLVFSFAEFSLNDLAALCRVCTGFHHAVVDSLYEFITVDNSDVCTTLAERPHLAKKVKSFIFTYPTIMVYDGPMVHMNDLALALKNMTCLSTLKLIHSQNHEYPSVLQYCDAELHIFHCTYPVDRQLLSFLNRQDSIHELALTGRPVVSIRPRYEEMFAPTSLPHLREVSANSFLLQDLVPGRPVDTVRFKGQHIHYSGTELRDFVDPSTVPVRNLGLDLMIWRPELICFAPFSKDLEEITLTGFTTWHRHTPLEYRSVGWEHCFDRMLASARNLKRLTFWFEAKREDDASWAQLIFKEFHDTLSRLEHVSCVVRWTRRFNVIRLVSGCLPIPHEDNRTRGHRAANDVRELMPIPVLCCRTEENLCDINSQYTISISFSTEERDAIFMNEIAEIAPGHEIVMKPLFG